MTNIFQDGYCTTNQYTMVETTETPRNSQSPKTFRSRDRCRCETKAYRVRWHDFYMAVRVPYIESMAIRIRLIGGTYHI